jgi:hypothetical protein
MLLLSRLASRAVGVSQWLVDLRSPTNCVVAPQVSSPRPPPLASWRSCLPERPTSLRGVSDPSRSQKDPLCSERRLPAASAKHLVALFGDAFLTGISVSRLVCGGHQPQVRTYRSSPFETVVIFDGEHEGERGQRPDPLDLAQEPGLWVALLGDFLQLSVVIPDALCERSDLLRRVRWPA